MAKICPKCGAAGLVGKMCPLCGAKLEDIPYRELIKRKPLWAIVPFISVLFVVLIIGIIIFKPPFFYSVWGSAIMAIVCLILAGLGFYMKRRMRAKAVKFERYERTGWKAGMISSYILGTISVITGIWTFILFSSLLGTTGIAPISAIQIIIGASLFVYAEYLRRKLKKK